MTFSVHVEVCQAFSVEILAAHEGLLTLQYFFVWEGGGGEGGGGGGVQRNVVSFLARQD